MSTWYKKKPKIPMMPIEKRHSNGFGHGFVFFKYADDCDGVGHMVMAYKHKDHDFDNAMLYKHDILLYPHYVENNMKAVSGYLDYYMEYFYHGTCRCLLVPIYEYGLKKYNFDMIINRDLAWAILHMKSKIRCERWLADVLMSGKFEVI